MSIVEILLYSVMFNLVAGYWIFNKLGIIESHSHMISLIVMFFIFNILASAILLFIYGIILYSCIKNQYGIDDLLNYIREKVHEERENESK